MPAPEIIYGVAFSAGINVPFTIKLVLTEIFLFKVKVLPELMVTFLKPDAFAPPIAWAMPEKVVALPPPDTV